MDNNKKPLTQAELDLVEFISDIIVDDTLKQLNEAKNEDVSDPTMQRPLITENNIYDGCRITKTD